MAPHSPRQSNGAGFTAGSIGQLQIGQISGTLVPTGEHDRMVVSSFRRGGSGGRDERTGSEGKHVGAVGGTPSKERGEHVPHPPHDAARPRPPVEPRPRGASGGGRGTVVRGASIYIEGEASEPDDERSSSSNTSDTTVDVASKHSSWGWTRHQPPFAPFFPAQFNTMRCSRPPHPLTLQG